MSKPTLKVPGLLLYATYVGLIGLAVIHLMKIFT